MKCVFPGAFDRSAFRVFSRCYGMSRLSCEARRRLLTDWSLVRVRPGELRKRGVSGTPASPFVFIVRVLSEFLDCDRSPVLRCSSGVPDRGRCRRGSGHLRFPAQPDFGPKPLAQASAAPGHPSTGGRCCCPVLTPRWTATVSRGVRRGPAMPGGDRNTRMPWLGRGYPRQAAGRRAPSLAGWSSTSRLVSSLRGRRCVG